MLLLPVPRHVSALLGRPILSQLLLPLAFLWYLTGVSLSSMGCSPSPLSSYLIILKKKLRTPSWQNILRFLHSVTCLMGTLDVGTELKPLERGLCE
jgi:hypothetical protein